MAAESDDQLAADRPNVAQMYDYWLGGTANRAIDRQAADRILQLEPLARETAWANRGFLQRVATRMARAGIDQILDIGAGLPTMNNTHDVVHRINPDARVVYVDSDPEAVTRGRQLIADIEGADYVRGDLTNIDALLTEPTVRELDWDRRIGVLLVGLLYFIPDPAPSVRRIVEALAPGSMVAISHVTADGQSTELVDQGVQVYKSATAQMHPRTEAEVTGLFGGLDLLAPYDGAEPGLCYVGQWGAEDPEAADDDAGRWLHGGLAVKPIDLVKLSEESHALLGQLADRIPTDQLEACRSLARGGEWPELIDLISSVLVTDQIPISPAERDALAALLRMQPIPSSRHHYIANRDQTLGSLHVGKT